MIPRPSPQEISYALYGVWRLARLDSNGLSYLRETEDAFWKSFFAAVICLPPYVVLAVIQLNQMELSAPLLKILLVEAIAYVISWAAFPLAAWHLVQMLDRQENYIRYIVAFNWSKVIQILVFLPVAVLAAGGLFGSLSGLVSLGVTLLILGYIWFITKHALKVTGGPAAGLVMLDLFISVAIEIFANSMIV
jgi:hypothetical protein